MIILLGSTRPAKVAGARAAIAAVASVDARFADPAIEPLDVGDVGLAMPMTEREIVDGARLRAMTLLQRWGGGDRRSPPRAEPILAVGLEGGLDPWLGDGPRYVLKAWAAVTDGVRWGFGGGGTIVLPEALGCEVAAGRELGDVIDRLAGEPIRGTRGAWGLLTCDLVTRQDAFKTAVLAALAPFYNSALYGVSP